MALSRRKVEPFRLGSSQRMAWKGSFLIIIAISVGGWSFPNKYEILSIFFDGVPNTGKGQQGLPDSLTADSSLAEGDTLSTPDGIFSPPAADGQTAGPGQPTAAVARQIRSIHPPYQERACTKCHIIEQNNALVEPMPGLCFKCHEDLSGLLDFVHGPVVVGACLVCHHPHRAEFPPLLQRQGQALCYYCHDSGEVLQNKVHSGIQKSNCLRCHNAHGGDNPFFLMTGTTEQADWTF